MSLISFSILASAKTQRVRLKKGQPAPFDGQLLSSEAAAKLVADRKALAKLHKAKLEKLKNEYEAKITALKLEKSLIQDACKTKTQILNGAVERTAKACEKKWYQSSWIPFIGGVAACGGAVALGASLK